MAVLDVAEGGVGKGRSCNWTLTSGFSFVLPRMSMQQSSFTLAGVGRICLIRGGGGTDHARPRAHAAGTYGIWLDGRTGTRTHELIGANRS